MLRFVIKEEINGITTEYGSVDISTGGVIAISLIFIAIIATFYALRSIGIYKLAKKQGVEKAYIAWIPCVWMFTACKIIGKSRVLGSTAERLAVWFCIIFSCAALLPAIYNFLTFFPYVMYYLEGGSIDIVSRGGIYIETGDNFNNLFDVPAVNVICRILYAFNMVLRFAEIFITVSVYIALFRKFWPEHYILAAVLSFLGLFPIMVFAIRNRNAVDFNEYIRNRYYGAGFTPYGNRYYGQGGSGTSYGGGSFDGREEPFDEFNNRPDEPFGEFSDSKNGDDDNGDNGNQDR